MKSHKLVSASLAFFCSLYCAETQGAQPVAGQQVEQIFKAKDSAEVPYLLYLPSEWKTGKDSLPIMLFLHGRGESDGPLSTVAKWGPPQMAARGDKLPFILVSPQCPKEDSWSSTTQQARLAELLDSVVEKPTQIRVAFTWLDSAWVVPDRGAWRQTNRIDLLPSCPFADEAISRTHRF